MKKFLFLCILFTPLKSSLPKFRYQITKYVDPRTHALNAISQQKTTHQKVSELFKKNIDPLLEQHKKLEIRLQELEMATAYPIKYYTIARKNHTLFTSQLSLFANDMLTITDKLNPSLAFTKITFFNEWYTRYLKESLGEYREWRFNELELQIKIQQARHMKNFISNLKDLWEKTPECDQQNLLKILSISFEKYRK